MLVLLATLPAVLPAQQRSAGAIDSTRFDALQWRFIGPYRGGRSAAVAGVQGDRWVYYFGATGGGVFKTVDGGMTWEPVTDGTMMAGSIGAIAVAPSDPNVVYVGTGESPPRGNVSPGNGMWKSTDAGRAWARAGLEDAGQIARIWVHPQDADVAYAAVLGHIFGPNETRGIYRTRDGGATWERVLYRDEHTGAIDLAVDATNPRIMYAALWQVRRSPWSLESGGPGGGLFKSTDGGTTWAEITGNDGLPEGTIGKIGVTVSPADPDRVWAIVEAEEGGVFRSDDGGSSWRRLNQDRSLRQRAWYYTHIHADPKDAETVYVMNTGLYRSVDGGRTYSPIRVPHGDNHALWIAPEDPERIINGNDGGANVSHNGGRTWTRQDNQPTAQMYHAFATEDFHYKVCGGQQDNSTICVPSRSDASRISTSEYHRVGGCESGYIAVRPDSTNISYAGCYGGSLDRFDLATGQERSIHVWPDNPMGWGAEELTYRFQWTFPIILSPHDPNVLYVTSQHVHRTTNGGQSWETVSGDLTRNDKSKQGASGGPITKDNTSVEYYNTIFTLAPSRLDASVIWAGSDDGLVHVSRDGGATWSNVTPGDLPDWAMISIIDASPHEPGAAYLAATRYKLDDFAPYLYKTTDFGRTWRKIVTGIPGDHFTRVIREDPDRRGLLYSGGEFGVYVSLDDGARWQSLRLNLPVAPTHDLIVHRGDLVAGTHGRGFWVLDDVSLFHQLTADVAAKPRHLFAPRNPLRRTASGSAVGAGSSVSGPPNGVVVRYYFGEKPTGEVKLEFLEEDGDLIRSFSSRGGGGAAPAGPFAFFGGGGSSRVSADAGTNQFTFNMRYPGASRFEGLIMWAAGTQGPLAPPGTYRVRLTAGDWSEEQTFRFVKDPRTLATASDLQAQFDFLIAIRDRTSEANDAVGRIRRIKSQLGDVEKRVAGHAQADTITTRAKAITAALSEVEAEIYQVRNRSRQDPLNFPIKLNNKIAALAGSVANGDARPTDQSRALFEELSAALGSHLDRLATIIETEVPEFNQLVRGADVPALLVTDDEAPRGRR
jgi:photosystem II stability/assembly factor-like uncharacterized protein